MATTRTETPSGLTLIGECGVCLETKMVPNKGLGRASLAAWESRHQHRMEEKADG